MSEVFADGLVKTYDKGSVSAVNDVSFSVEKGELFGLIGPDGAGKTSIFRMLTTLLLPDSGSASVAGLDMVKDFRQIRRIIGYMPGKFSLYQDLSVEENLTFFATLFNTTIKENFDLIKDIYLHIEPFKTRRAGKLSGGMKQKLALCCALIHRPKVLFLDEPTTGVDAVSRKELWQMLKKLKDQGITILVSTPYMDEAALCDRIALIQNGEIMDVNEPERIIDKFPDPLYAFKSEKMSLLLTALREMKAVKSVYSFGANHHVTLNTSELNTLDNIKDDLINSGHPEIQINEIDASIEDCFINLMTATVD